MPAGIKPNDGTTAPSVTVRPGSITIPLGLSAIVVPSRRAPVAPPPQVKRAARKPARKRGGLAYLVLAAGLALAASGFVLNRHWSRPIVENAPVVASKPDPAAQHKSGQIIIPRANSELCDRWSFDNASGQMKKGETMPCSNVGKRPEINLTDQVNSFHSSWRGSGPAPRGEGGPNAPRGEKAP